MARRAVIGFRGIALAPLTENTILKYASGQAVAIPFTGGMTKTPKETTQDFYYDDKIYAQVKELMGEEVEIRFAEIELERMAELGLGEYDPDTHTLEGNFAVEGRQYALRCVTDTIDKLPYYFNYRVFDLNGIRYDNFTTKGSNIAICEVVMTGTLMQPNMDSVKPFRLMALAEDRSNLEDCEALLRDGETFPPTQP